MKKIFLSIILISLASTLLLSQTDPKETEYYSPVPPKVTPGVGTTPPSDAIVLFDGKNMDQWVMSKDKTACQWILDTKEGIMTVPKGLGGIETKRYFKSCQLHVEWRSPNPPKGTGQDCGNSGVFLQSKYEVQVLDNYTNTTYVNGQAGSIYKQTGPLVNASLKPGEWQTYDIIWNAPKFDADGKLVQPATITVLHNGILIQNNWVLKGHTPYIGQPKYEAHGALPLALQDHAHPVSYRNIWIREL
ncbi:MAG: DUF1080 domain-containing protein [Saprospiraceae bacterium]|nr:DUF1080 domain-containing protein [Saprospiraceae bacterium]